MIVAMLFFKSTSIINVFVQKMNDIDKAVLWGIGMKKVVLSVSF